MKRVLLFSSVFIIAVSLVFTLTLAGCVQEAESVAEAEETETEETVTEETTVEDAAEEETVKEETTVEEEPAEEEVEEESGDEVASWILEKREGLEDLRYDLPPEAQGPDGQTPTWDTELVLTNAEIEEIREGREDGQPYKLAVNLDGDHAEHTTAMLKGIEEVCEYLNIEIVAVGNAEYNPEKQLSDIETIMALDPDIIIAAPVDRVTASEVFRPAVEAGVSLAFWSNTPADYTHGEDYVGISAADVYGEGVLSGEGLGEIVGGSGQVGFAVIAAEFWICNYVDNLAKETVEEKYPDIEVVAWEGWPTVPEAENIAAAMIQTNPDIEGIYVSWSEPAQYVAAACLDAGREDIKISTLGVNAPGLINLLTGGNFGSIVTDMPYYMGINHALVGAHGLIDKECPEFTVCPVVAINESNLEEVWEMSFNIPLPDEVIEVME